MVRGEKTKTAALVLVAVMLLLYVIQCVSGFSPADYDFGKDSSVLCRLVYPFLHASLLHVIGNCWCLLLIVFYYNIGMSRLLIAYVVAVTAPAFLFSSVTIGFSSVIFCLFGQTVFAVRRKMYLNCWILYFILLGFLLPAICSLFGWQVAAPNNFIHIYCYVVGLLVGFLNSPAPWQRRK